MAGFKRKMTVRDRPAPRAAVPDDIARALDASTEDLRQGRTADVGEFLETMKKKLAAHRATKTRSPRR